MPSIGDKRTVKTICLLPEFPFVGSCYIDQIFTYTIMAGDRGPTARWVTENEAHNNKEETKKKRKTPSGYHRATGVGRK